MILGGPLFGYFGDKFGRRTVVASILFTSSIIGGGVFLFRSYAVYVVLRFTLGCLMQGLANSINVLIVELFPTKYRVYAVLILLVTEVCGALVFVLLSYLIKDWKYIQLTLAIFTFLQLLFFLSFAVPESLRWYLAHRKFDKAELLVKRVVEFNRLPFPRELFNEIQLDFSKSHDMVTSQRQRKANILDVIKSPKLLKITLVMSFLWFTTDMNFFMLALNMSSLHGSKYLNIAISYLVDLVALLAFIWFLPRFGRRKPLFLILLCCAVTVGGNAVITSSSYNNAVLQTLRTVLAIIGKMSIYCGFGVLFILTSEIYPTVVRNVSLGVNTLSSRLGAMLAPQMILLGVYTTTSVPYTILSILALVGALLTWLLPETHNRDLSDKLDCTEMIYAEATEKKSLTVQEQILAYETSI